MVCTARAAPTRQEESKEGMKVPVPMGKVQPRQPPHSWGTESREIAQIKLKGRKAKPGMGGGRSPRAALGLALLQEGCEVAVDVPWKPAQQCPDKKLTKSSHHDQG